MQAQDQILLKMRKIYSLISLFIVIVFTVTIFNQKNKDPRSEYEKFLLEKAAFHSEIGDEHTRSLRSPDKPEMAAFQEYIKTVDPELGYVPKERLWSSYQKTLEIEEEVKALRDDPIVEWQGTEANMGGRTRAIMFDPNDEDLKKVWAGGVTGGLWYNDDIINTNVNWTPIGDFWSNLAISCITYDPNNTQTFYVGTGEAQTARIIYRESSGLGAGIFRSVDAGETWELMPSTSDFEYITDIVIKDEDGTSVIYVCVASGTYMGEDHESQPTDGLYRSDDGGETWDQVLPEIIDHPGEIYTPSEIDIAANGRIFIGTMENLNMNGGATILYSDTGLEGSWEIYDHYNDVISIPARTNVAIAPSDPDIVYAQFAGGYWVNSGYYNYKGKYIAKSTDGGATWQQKNKPSDDWANRAWHNFILKVDPNDPETVITGGNDLWKSSNSGNSWNHISYWWNYGEDDYVHADQHNIQYQQGSNSTAIFASDGGVFLTNTAHYTQPVFIERNQGYNTLQFYTGAINPIVGSDNYIGGLQDNGTVLYTGSPLDINDMIDGGDGAYCFYDENEPQIYITSVYYNSYTAWVNGSSVSYFGDGGTFICPADYDSENNILYANGVTFSCSNANKINRNKGIPYNVTEQMVHMGTSSSVPFSHVKYSDHSPVGTSTLFLGTQAGKLYKVENAESSPHATEITGSNFPTASISCVAIGSSEDILTVTFSNYGVSSVWFTDDGGASWIEKEANLPDMPIRWALFHPENDGQVMLATETGIWVTNMMLEDETIWYPANYGMANVRVDMLKLRKSDNTVLAATHGRGLCTATYELSIFYVGEDEYLVKGDRFLVYPNPAHNNISLSLDLDRKQEVMIMISSLSGKHICNNTTSGQKGAFEQNIDIGFLNPGIYLLTINYNHKTKTQKLIVN